MPIFMSLASSVINATGSYEGMTGMAWDEKKVLRPGQIFTPATLTAPANKCSLIATLTNRRAIHMISTRRSLEASSTLNIPMQINDTFEETYDINMAHNKILQILAAEREQKKKEYPHQIEELRQAILREKNTILRNELDHRFTLLQEEEKYICQGYKIQAYQKEVKTLLDEFCLLRQPYKKVMFNTKKQDIMEDEGTRDLHNRRLIVIFSFVQIAKKYVDISVTMLKTTRNVCNECDCDMSDLAPNEYGVIYCPQCKTEKTFVKEIYYQQACHDFTKDYYISTNRKKKIKDIKIRKTKAEYFDITNFKKLVDAFQGRSGNRLPSTEELRQQLDAYFQKKKMPLCQEICTMPSDIRGRRGKIVMSQLYDIFTEIGHSEYCEDGFLIAHLVLGWKLPDLSKYEEMIYEDYRKTQRVLSSLENKGRSSSLGRYYRLFKHLELVGYPCNYYEDFKVNKMKETLLANEELWRQMCEGANDERIYFIPTL